MNDEKKYFGMTMMQIGILGGLALVLVCIIASGGGLILRGRFSKSSQQITIPTAAPTVTQLPAIPPTMTPTIVPTPIPYEQLIPEGWNQFETELIEIWLPSNFKKTTEKDLGIQAGVDIIELVAKETASKTSAYNMVVLVAYDPITEPTLDEYLKKELDLLQEEQARATEYRTVHVNGVEARRIVIEARDNNIDVNALIYVFQDGSTAWYVEYVAQINEFFENLSMFEQSVQTFRPAQ
jgi:hypothetical protein